MKIALAIFVLVAGVSAGALADDNWQQALAQMPLGVSATELNRTNTIPIILNAFQSNSVVKALIFMPGAADEFVFLRRAHVTLTNANFSLADAIVALTNQTYIRAEFQAPFLLLYNTQDTLESIATIKSKSTAARLQARIVPGHMLFCDCNWDFMRPVIARKLSVGVRPFSNSPESWHFWPANFAAYNLTQWELIETVARTSKTTFTLYWLTVHFQLDSRMGPVQNLKNFPGP
jgi:hypothetical protein